MALFNRLLRKFKSSDFFSEQGPEVVPFSQLLDWLKERYQEKLVQSGMETEFENYSSRLKDLAWEIKCLLHQWERKSNSLYKNYPLEEVNYLFLESKRLLEMLGENITFKTVSAFNKNLSEKLSLFFTEIESGVFSQSYSLILSEEEHFEDSKPNPERDLRDSRSDSLRLRDRSLDVSAVKEETDRSDLNLINSLLKEMVALNRHRKNFEKSIEQSGLLRVKNLLLKAVELEEIVRESNARMKLLKEELLVKRERLRMAEESWKEKNSQYLALSSDPNFPLLSKVETKHRKLVAKMEENDDAVFVFFSKLRSGLKQFSEIEPERKMIRDYLDNPLPVFYADKKLEILEIVSRLGSALASKKIKLDSDSAEQVRDYLEKASSGGLEELQEKHFHLVRELDQLKLNLDDKNLLLKMEDLRYRLDHFQQQAERLHEEINLIEEEIGRKLSQQEKEVTHFIKIAQEVLERNLELRF